jgi:hypothetical protein
MIAKALAGVRRIEFIRFLAYPYSEQHLNLDMMNDTFRILFERNRYVNSLVSCQ